MSGSTSINISPQTPVFTGNALSMAFVVGPTPIESFDLEIAFDPAVLNAASLGVTSVASGWNVLLNVVGSSISISGFAGNLTALATGSTIFRLTGNLQTGASRDLYLDISGSYNDPAVTIPITEFSFLNSAPTGEVVVSGTTIQGKTLTANTSALADADGLGAFSYQWKADGKDIATAEDDSYVVTGYDFGKRISVTASYVDGQGALHRVNSDELSPAVLARQPDGEDYDVWQASPDYETWLASVEEFVPSPFLTDGAQGDGNGDGVPDKDQDSVASLPFVISSTVSSAPPNTEQTFVTLVAETGSLPDGAVASLSNIRQQDSAAGLPAGINLPLGMIAFDSPAILGGGAESAYSLYVDASLGITGYWKQNSKGVWVNLASEPYGGNMEIVQDKLKLTFKIADDGEFDDPGDNEPDGLGTGSLSLAGAVPDIPSGAMWL